MSELFSNVTQTIYVLLHRLGGHSSVRPLLSSMANPKPQAPKVYQTYRFSTLGMALNDALDEMVASEEIPADVAKKVLSRFDSSISAGLTFANVRGKFSVSSSSQWA